MFIFLSYKYFIQKSINKIKLLNLSLQFLIICYNSTLLFKKGVFEMSQKQITILGWVATFMSVMMYVSYISQIMNNLSGNKGDFIQPAVAAFNCVLWVCYGLFKEERDIPLAAANAPGIIFGIVTVITAIM